MKRDYAIVLSFILLFLMIVGAIYSYRNGLFLGSKGIVSVRDVNYVAKGDQCKTVRFVCDKGLEYFQDEVGCGCRISNSVNVSNEGNRNYCMPNERASFGCTKEYAPVCGWFNIQIECFKYPCAATYSNKCMACLDEKVDYWTSGECPS